MIKFYLLTVEHIKVFRKLPSKAKTQLAINDQINLFLFLKRIIAADMLKIEFIMYSVYILLQHSPLKLHYFSNNKTGKVTKNATHDI